MYLGYNMHLVHNSYLFTILGIINLVLLTFIVSFYICTKDALHGNQLCVAGAGVFLKFK